MMRILKLLTTLVICVSVSTVVAEGAGLLYLWSAGSLQQDRLFRALAAVHGVDLHEIQTELENANKPQDIEQVSFEEKQDWRVAKSLDLDRREAAINKALSELRQLQAELKVTKDRYTQIRDSFKQELDELQAKFVQEGILDVEKTLEALQPKQAKDQILKMLKDEPIESQAQAMNDVVAIIKAMPLDKRKKILSEFKTDEEAEVLREILRNIRLGEPEVTLTRNARDDLQSN